MSGEPAAKQQQNSSAARQQKRVESATPERRSFADLFAELDEQEHDKVEATIGHDAWESIKAKILPGLKPREVK